MCAPQHIHSIVDSPLVMSRNVSLACRLLAALHSFYVSYFPTPCAFELPAGQSNEYRYVHEYRAARAKGRNGTTPHGRPVLMPPQPAQSEAGHQAAPQPVLIPPQPVRTHNRHVQSFWHPLVLGATPCFVCALVVVYRLCRKTPSKMEIESQLHIL